MTPFLSCQGEAERARAENSKRAAKTKAGSSKLVEKEPWQPKATTALKRTRTRRRTLRPTAPCAGPARFPVLHLRSCGCA